MYVSIHPELSTKLNGLWSALGLADCPSHGGSLWMRLRAPATGS